MSDPVNKKSLTEADIRTKHITPAVLGSSNANWDSMTQVREEFYFTKGRVMVQGKTVKRGQAKKKKSTTCCSTSQTSRSQSSKPKTTIMRLATGCSRPLNTPNCLTFHSHIVQGDGFLEHDRTGASDPVERQISLDEFPHPGQLWTRYCMAKGLSLAQESIAKQDYYDDGTGKTPRYYQLKAINRTVEAIARGENRILR